MPQRPSRPELTLPRFLAVNALVSLGFGLGVGWSGGSLAGGVVAFALAFVAFQPVWLVLLVRTARADARDAAPGSAMPSVARERRARATGPGVARSLRRGPSRS